MPEEKAPSSGSSCQHRRCIFAPASRRIFAPALTHGVVDEEISSLFDLVLVWIAPFFQQMNGDIHSVDRPVPHFTLMGVTNRALTCPTPTNIEAAINVVRRCRIRARVGSQADQATT